MGRAPVNYMAWTGLLVSVSGFIFNVGVNGVVGMIFSILGLREARRLAAAGHEQTGRSLALAGLITGIAHIVVTAALVVLSVFAFFWFTDWINTLTTQIAELEPQLAELTQLGGALAAGVAGVPALPGCLRSRWKSCPTLSRIRTSA